MAACADGSASVWYFISALSFCDFEPEYLCSGLKQALPEGPEKRDNFNQDGILLPGSVVCGSHLRSDDVIGLDDWCIENTCMLQNNKLQMSTDATCCVRLN